jgi:hypothetical protein
MAQRGKSVGRNCILVATGAAPAAAADKMARPWPASLAAGTAPKF